MYIAVMRYFDVTLVSAPVSSDRCIVCRVLRLLSAVDDTVNARSRRR